MKRYWLFSGECYYAHGGMNDFIDSFDTVEECEAAFEVSGDQWYQILDSSIPHVVKRSKRRPHGAQDWNEGIPAIAKPPSENT